MKSFWISSIAFAAAAFGSQAQAQGLEIDFAIQGKITYSLTENKSLSKSEIQKLGLNPKANYTWKRYYETIETDIKLNGMDTGKQPVEPENSHALAFNPDDSSSMDLIDLHETDPAKIVQDVSLQKGDVVWDADKNLVTAKVDQALRTSGLLGSVIGVRAGQSGVGVIGMTIQVNKYVCTGKTVSKTLVCDVDFRVKASMDIEDEEDDEEESSEDDWNIFNSNPKRK